MATTTTIYQVDVEGADPELAQLVTDLYAYDGSDSAPAAPEAVLQGFVDAEDHRPTAAVASVAAWDEETRLAVITSGNDVTLAIAEPEWRVIGGWWPDAGVSLHLGPYPKVFAVIGSDARPDENRDTARSDSIHFVSFDETGNAAVVGVPRDSWVSIPSRGNSKINAALSLGGPDLMMGTIVNLTGLDFNGYLLTGFAGFQGLIDVLGGLEINVPMNFNDQASKNYLDAGQQVINAAQALALSRTRKTIPGGDFTRQRHGGLIIMAAQAMMRAAGPSILPELIAGARPHLSSNLGPAELLIAAAAITRVAPDATINTVAPGGVGTAGSASVVFLRDSASDLWTDLADGRLDQDWD